MYALLEHRGARWTDLYLALHRFTAIQNASRLGDVTRHEDSRREREREMTSIHVSISIDLDNADTANRDKYFEIGNVRIMQIEISRSVAHVVRVTTPFDAVGFYDLYTAVCVHKRTW